MTLDLGGAFRLARVIHPHQTLGKPMDLNVNLELEQLVKSTSLVSFNELVNEILKGSAE